MCLVRFFALYSFFSHSVVRASVPSLNFFDIGGRAQICFRRVRLPMLCTSAGMRYNAMSSAFARSLADRITHTADWNFTYKS
ncbi:hypothetical protein R3P38DRAFT_2939485 [Favolaschia claudopus]|uniref:Secreted protein n=1 Tax=Favolaschia claudopus TaxID=2862362 RepID=A0AAW0BLZ9_9AGAR